MCVCKCLVFVIQSCDMAVRYQNSNGKEEKKTCDPICDLCWRKINEVLKGSINLKGSFYKTKV